MSLIKWVACCVLSWLLLSEKIITAVVSPSLLSLLVHSMWNQEA